MHCGRYIRITVESTQVLLIKKDCAYLMEIASACIDRQVIIFIRLQDDLVEWWNKCLQEKSFCTSPNAYCIDFDSLYGELSHKTCFFNKNNPDPND